MRANEFIAETINPDILNPNFHHEQEINGMIYSAKTGPMSNAGKQLYLTIECRNPEIPDSIAGMAVFIIMDTIKGQWLESMDTYVVGDYKMSGIASTMYAYAKMLGNDVRPSTVQMPGGKAMWKAWRKSGAAKHLMREGINPDILNKKFKHTQVIGDYTYTASVEMFLDEPLLTIKAFNGNKEIGHTLFQLYNWENNPAKGYMESGGTEVDTKYRNKGIASTMYAYAKMLGNDIRPSIFRSDQGKAMWASWDKSGDAKYLTK